MRDTIGNAKLINIFGRWPSFHDSEIWKLICERTESGVSVEATIHVFEKTAEVDERGFYRLTKHTLVTLRFTGCVDVGLNDFNGQNVLNSLSVSDSSDGLLSVNFDSSYGLDGEFKCRQIEVVDAQPWIPPHGVYAPRQ